MFARVGEGKSVETTFGGVARAEYADSIILLVRRVCVFGSVAEPMVATRLLHAPVVVTGVLMVLGVVLRLLLVLQVLAVAETH